MIKQYKFAICDDDIQFAIRLNHILLNIMEKTRWKYLFLIPERILLNQKLNMTVFF